MTPLEFRPSFDPNHEQRGTLKEGTENESRQQTTKNHLETSEKMDYGSLRLDIKPSLSEEDFREFGKAFSRDFLGTVKDLLDAYTQCMTEKHNRVSSLRDKALEPLISLKTEMMSDLAKRRGNAVGYEVQIEDHLSSIAAALDDALREAASAEYHISASQAGQRAPQEVSIKYAGPVDCELLIKDKDHGSRRDLSALDYGVNYILAKYEITAKITNSDGITVTKPILEKAPDDNGAYRRYQRRFHRNRFLQIFNSLDNDEVYKLDEEGLTSNKWLPEFLRTNNRDEA